LEDSGDRRQQIKAGQLLVGAVVGSVAEETEFVAILEPVGDLFDSAVSNSAESGNVLRPHSLQ